MKRTSPVAPRDDPTNAQLALELLVRHPEQFKPLKPQSVEMRKLLYLVEQRRRLVDSALRALALKWIRILYRCWQTRTPYDESRYLKALKRRDSPLHKQLGASTRGGSVGNDHGASWQP